jgi:hypothetical protein
MRQTLAIAIGLALSGCDRTPAFETTADVRCLAAIGRMPEVTPQESRDTDEGALTLTTAGSLYYLGRVHGREPRLDLENALIVEILGMDTEKVRSELIRCGEEMSVAGAKWETIGKNLAQRGQRGQGRAPLAQNP